LNLPDGYYAKRSRSFQVSADGGVSGASGTILAMTSSDASPNGSDQDVFGSLPRSRPQRRSAKRDRPARPAATRTAPRGPAKDGAKAKPKAAAGRAGTVRAARPKAPSAKAKATRARSKPAAASAVPPAGYATPRAGDEGPHATDVVTTAIQAAGELAQIGLTVGAQALRSALRRLPRP
jgi:hypothetical protein